MVIKFKIIFCLLVILVAFHPIKVHAEDLKTEYQAEYFLDDHGSDLETKVKLDIKITYLKSTIIVDKFSLVFPDNFNIRNVTALENGVEIKPLVTPQDKPSESEGKKIKIDLNLSHPIGGRGSINDISIEFYQDNLFKINGNVWEVILPVINNNNYASSQIIVNLPKNSNKKITISKPKPDLIDGDKIIWQNIKNKTIYAVFGDKQIYDLKLKYQLKNTDLVPVYDYIALPPDTLNQKNYINSIDPLPVSVSSDIDGNLMAQYLLKPKETKTIIYNGQTEIFAVPRGEIIPLINEQIEKQKKYLLSNQKYWSLNKTDQIQDLNNTEDIYNFVTKYLTYNYNRAYVKDPRLGADKILTNPNQAICTDFTDLFIAASRKKGIMAREIEGYGFSQDKLLRPQSLSADVLHAWPEYYDTTQKIWRDVDPTWENTSGIDYYHSWDLNHIAFVIHGADSEFPIPAGMYKFENSKDVDIKISKTLPKENINLVINKSEVNKNINEKNTYHAKVTLYNKSNIYLWNFFVDIDSQNLSVNPNKIKIDSIAPFEKREIELNYKAQIMKPQQSSYLSLIAFNKTLVTYPVKISSLLTEQIQKIFVTFLVTFFAVFFVIILRRNRKK